MSLLTKIFGDANERFLSTLVQEVTRVSVFEEKFKALSDVALKEKTIEYKQRFQKLPSGYAENVASLQNTIRTTVSDDEKNKLRRELIKLKNEPLNEILPEAFALVREAACRTLGQRHFDVQLMGGMVLHAGQIAEMKTGEGKTLVATLAVYLNALSDRGVHVITVNDYLAKRDAVWMAQVYHALGLSVGVIVHDAAYLYDPSHATAAEDEVRDLGVTVEMDYLRPVERKAAYDADITYGTNNEFGFDYLRDNMVVALKQKVQRELNFAIVDEVDSILIDEARTPLIISAPDTESTDKYYKFAQIVESLAEHEDYAVDEKMRAATLTEHGIAKIEKILGVENIYVQEGIQTVHHIEQALKAKALFARDRDYTVKDNEVIIVDEFTGRMLPGRRYSEGLHQAIEAKEGVSIQRESKTMATITFQNYFRLYEKLAGMTGTAETEAEELAKIYNLDVTSIPTNKAMVRKDMQDRIYKNYEAKLKAVVAEIQECSKRGQPVLVGTISIEKNEYLARLLEQEGVNFNILNAKQHEREAEVIAQAGTKSAVTIATNMAGRGVDIKLGGSPFDEEKFKEIVALGGLHVLGTERHESRRIDNQLRGRSGRQGEPGSTQFFISLEDDLMRIFGADRVKTMMKSWPEDMPIENTFISRSIESAQKKVEGNNFDIRKHLVDYDDVINKQRTVVYSYRNQILYDLEKDPESYTQRVENEITAEIEDAINFHAGSSLVGEWNIPTLLEILQTTVGLTKDNRSKLEGILGQNIDGMQLRSQLTTTVTEMTLENLKALRFSISKQLATPEHQDPMTEILASLHLRSIDLLWVEHLETIDYLRAGIGLRGYGQRDPLIEYKRESKDLFNALLANIRRQFVQSIFRVAVGQPTTPEEHQHLKVREQKATLQSFSDAQEKSTPVLETKVKNAEGQKLGRNDPCFCGSGKKYKKCHGA